MPPWSKDYHRRHKIRTDLWLRPQKAGSERFEGYSTTQPGEGLISLTGAQVTVDQAPK